MKLKRISNTIFLVSLATAQETLTGANSGNCYTQRLNFQQNRVYQASNPSDIWPDPQQYDFILKAGSKADFNSDGTTTLHLNPGSGSNIALTRFVKFGKISAKFTPSQSNGAVTGFITISAAAGTAMDGSGITAPINDEIDWEILGKDTTKPEVNLFTYKSTLMERGMHGGPISGSVPAGGSHVYTIDWRADGISWAIDGQIMKTLSASSSVSVEGGLPPGIPWFPTMPSRPEISLWDGSSLQSWAGGPVDFTKPVTAVFEYIDVQCYDSNNTPVPKWPADAPDPAPNTTSPNFGNPDATSVTYNQPARSSSEMLLGVSSLFTFITGYAIFMLFANQ